MKSLAVILCLISLVAYGESVPSSRRVDWFGNAGIPGGIPNNRTIWTNMAANANAAQIQNAVNNCPPGQVVKLAAGTNNIGTTPISIQRGITLRGTVINGTNATTIIGVAPGASFVGLVYVGALPSTKAIQRIFAGGNKGSTNITLTSPDTKLNIGKIAFIDQTNDTGLVFGTGVGTKEDERGGGSALYWMHQQFEIRRVVPATGNTNFDIWPPLVWNFTNHASLFYRYASGVLTNYVSYAGIEDLTIQNTGATGVNGGQYSNVGFTATRYCWMKNVRSVNGYGQHLWAQNNFGLEVRGNTFTGSLWGASGSGGYGLIIEDDHADIIEDNIVVGIRDFIKLGTGASGNVVLYNYMTNSIPNPSALDYVQKSGIAHSSHPMMNLFEGNVCYVPTIDQYFGSASHFTLLRNWFRGPMASQATKNARALRIEKHQFQHNVVGNILGSSAIYSRFANRSTLLLSQGFNPGGTAHTDYHTIEFGFYDWDTGWNAATDIDATAQWANTIYAGNYDFVVTNQTWSNGVSSQTISNSYYYTAAPNYFGTSFTWPPFNPATNALRYGETNIPAGWRYTYGTNRPYGILANVNLRLDLGERYTTNTTQGAYAFYSTNCYLTNIGNADITIGIPLSSGGQRVSLTIFPPSATYTLTPGSFKLITASLYTTTNDLPGIYTENFVLSEGVAITASYRLLQLLPANALPATNVSKANDFAVSSGSLSASGNTTPFIPGQSGEAYFGFTLTNLSVVNLFGSVQATNAVNSFAVEVDGEPVYPKSVWDVPATGAGFVTNYMMFRGLGTASKPTGKQWLLQAGTHYVKIYSQTANTKIAKVIVDVRPIIQQVQSAGVGAGGITSQ